MKEIIKQAENYIKQVLEKVEKGHDWQHINRVRNTALKIAKREGGDIYIIELAALLHDISDAKFNGGDEKAGKKKTIEYLKILALSNEMIEKVAEIVDKISFKGGFNDNIEKNIELQVVQDADRLDAIGAIGIARAFNYGGYRNREIYNPDILLRQYDSPQAYHKSDAPTINHFYEKLLLLKDRMNTQTGKKMAEKRHHFMELFLKEFLEEIG